MNEILSKIKSIIIEKLGVDEKKVIPEASFINDLGADSLDSIELIMEFEKEFDIIISDDIAEKLITVDDANQYIKKYLDDKDKKSF
ncbi:acyl carrier protein [Candidatus Karelsulcia muelleri DMIN]|uniref:Acyl carrier protein n=1 Tax=Karelsulcia muelleri (strain DMIN) TaxID=641892 RepID=D5D8F5_KARMD|nr:acyl carrier protein [Candidatus Karelsulcia muelleri DMIN]